MTTKHTPSPWRIKTDGNISNCIEGYSGKKLFDGDTGYRTIAMFQSCESSGIAKAENENAQANARLIAAAPDLLAALEACSFREDIMDDELGDMIEAAIARAKG